MKLASEGTPFVFVGVIVLAMTISIGVLQGGMWWLGTAVWAPVATWIPVFFRDPQRHGPRGDQLVVAPADGKVVLVDHIDEPDFLRGPATRVAIFMNVFNVHVNRYPTNGVVEYRRYRPGRFLNASLDKASMHNEQMSLGVHHARGRVLIRQIAGLIARRIVTDHDRGHVASQGARLGMIRFGSRVETILPRSVRVLVAPGQHVLAGKTVLGEWAE